MQLSSITLSDAQADALYLALVGSDPTAEGAPARAARDVALVAAHIAHLREHIRAAHGRLLEAGRSSQRAADEKAAANLAAALR